MLQQKDREPRSCHVAARCTSCITISCFVRIHQTLKMSPAMAAGVTKKLWKIEDVVNVLETWELLQFPEVT